MIIAQVSIDLTKIDKTKIKEHQNGSKYYAMSVIVSDEKDQYGNDVSITQDQTKEEREAKAKKVYLGNGRVVFRKDGEASKPSPVQGGGEINDLPF